ncbi:MULTISPECIES: hypothetical protein [unclassified Bacillus (in: firmicutes)]|uniref:hypothetical protein n=1 Tax=unclassified Bacillus (in: firmicutes) TaxID=185979 RepID=UPI000BEF21EF|nr:MULTISPECIES: hypothetical protein [unclassified Bacillus (in: firmicutes)]PEJ47732.1 hypothetical protein CN692_24575 [Bacillus sp. AFS002410]PEK98330.1 hypothetical protein CN601_25825 [Bacillus sp. AFS017336]
MGNLKRYVKWVFKFNNRKYDLIELLLEIIFLPLIFVGARFLLSHYPFMVTLLAVFVAINLYAFADTLLRKTLEGINVNIPKWISIIPSICVFACIIFIYK